MLAALLAAVQPDVAELTRRALPSVVVVTAAGRSDSGLGTGFVVSADGLVATNFHVISEGRPVEVEFAGGARHPVRWVHAVDRSLDLAVVRIEARGLAPLELADDPLPQGASVVALGNPQGLKHSVVTGVVSAVRVVEGRPMIQLAIPVEPGNSGGPVLGLDGRVHGILTMKAAASENIGFALEARALRRLLEKPNPVPMERWLTVGQLDPKEWSVRLGAHWRRRAGKITVEGKGEGFGGRSLCISELPVPEPPYEATVSVRLKQEDGAAGLIFAFEGDDRHYGFYPTNGSMRLTRFEGPTVWDRWTILSTVQSPDYRAGEWNALKVRVEKDRIRCYVNGRLVIESDDALYRRGKIGLAKYRHTEAEFKGLCAGRELPPSEPAPEEARRLGELAREEEITPGLVERALDAARDAPAALREEARKLVFQAERLRVLARLAHERKVEKEMAAALARPEDDIDLIEAALLIARLDDPDVDVAACRREFDRLAETPVGKDATESEKLGALRRRFFEELLFHGSRTDYYSPSNSFLNEVMDDREGLPISLSVLFLEMGRRLGIRIVGVPLPGHFVVRFEPRKGEPELIDVFEGGRRMTMEEVRAIIRHGGSEASEDELQAATEEALKPASKRAILLRMLRNLLGSASDEDARLRYLGAILAIDPENMDARARRIDGAARAGRIRQALADLEWFEKKRPEGLDLGEIRRRILEQSKGDR